ncbi:MGMT family protein [Albibacterium sp.]|uniref:MGMT family protein n=1 Tax=Albibacterium sp. TaxID=2952885 RepID=UPI002B91ACEE|nr:MGMT family protein [Albibacterium sp.]HUH19922.1 MGMT family protein [Albibacterium sp.]
MITKETFYDRVYQIVRQIPEGRVTSYGAIAKALGTAGSARMVGYALRASQGIYPPIPAHRVVNRVGMLSGKSAFGSSSMMQQLLENESIVVENDQVVDFKNLFWKPDYGE